MNVVSKQQCAFVQFTNRASAEVAAEKSFNKLIINGRRLNIKWGRSQGLQAVPRPPVGEIEMPLEPVPGLPGGKLLEHVLHCVRVCVCERESVGACVHVSSSLSALACFFFNIIVI